jgi:hypothetical protein
MFAKEKNEVVSGIWRIKFLKIRGLCRTNIKQRI